VAHWRCTCHEVVHRDLLHGPVHMGRLHPQSPHGRFGAYAVPVLRPDRDHLVAVLDRIVSRRRDPAKNGERHRKQSMAKQGKPGPLQRQVLMVLHAARIQELGPLYAKDIAKVLSHVLRPDGTHFIVTESSVQGALSGMMVCHGRYWIAKHPFGRYSITRNGLAWL
jgi:hypothetical protein